MIFIETLLHCWRLRLLPVVVEMLEILLNGVDGLVRVVNTLVMLRWVHIRWKGVSEVCGNNAWRLLSKEAVEKFFHEIPTEDRNETWSVIDFDQDSLEVLVLAHRHTSKFYKKVSKLESRTFRLNLNHVFGGVDWIHFEHEQIKDEVRDKRNLLYSIIQQRKH